MSSAPHFDVSVLTTAYLPPVEYFFAVAHSGRVLVEQYETYQKQSWRNRCRIFATAGPEDLSIPVVKDERHGRPIRDIRIDYSEPWLQHHIRAFAAAYNASAFYDYYADDIIPILESRPGFLFDLNMELLERILGLLDLHVPVSLTDDYLKGYPAGVFDGRHRIQPKYKGLSLLDEQGREQAYYQVFVNREPGPLFVPNLSIIDLLSAEGPDAGRWLL